jgi:Family of unknown function (DUF5686)/CarboxypepD_reg-like domain
MHKTYLFIGLFLFLEFVVATAQNISGKVIDSIKYEPIAFANVSLEDGIRGTTSDIEGNFMLKIPVNYQGKILVSHVSYQRKKLSLDYFEMNEIILLKPGVTVLKEFTFVAEENPAFRIIRNAIANRDKHDPDNLNAYQYISYNKFLVTADEAPPKIDSLVRKLSEKERKELSEKQRNLLTFDSLMKTSHLFLSESVTEQQVKNPDQSKEKLLALQVSGFKSPLFTNVATDYQPFSFYREKITLLQKDYTNPIAKGTFNRYDFYLTDTTYQDADTVFIIQFQPKQKRLFNGLEGSISIITDGFAIKNVIASGSDPLALTNIRIQQNYEKIDNHWFPVQLNTDLNFSKANAFGRGIKAQHRSFHREVQINPSLKNTSFGDIKIELSVPKSSENKLILDKYRTNPVDTKESRTYVLMDSVAKKARAADKILEAFATSTIRVGLLDFDLDKVMRFNRYEKFRIGMGLYTNDRLSKIMRVGGYYGYGFGDQKSKYGGEMRFTFNQDRGFSLSLSYSNDIYEVGIPFYNKEGQRLNSEIYRNWVGYVFDRSENFRSELGYRLLPDVHATAFISRNQITPTYDYSLTINGEPKNSFLVTETGIALRYAKRETYFLLNGKKIFLRQRFPIITFSLTKSINLLDAVDFDYTRYDFSIKHYIKHRTLGKTNLQLTGGLLDGIAPYGRLYIGRGASATQFYVDGFFQTMGLYEFTNTQYASLFLNHNFGNVLMNKRFSKPELLLFHNMGIGILQHAEAHKNIALQSMEKGFVESGLGLNNLLRLKYFNVAYFGFGGSIFYRYGPYQLPSLNENLVYRLHFYFSF